MIGDSGENQRDVINSVIDYEITDERWKSLNFESICKSCIDNVFWYLDIKYNKLYVVEISVLLADSEKLRELNLKYRNISNTTNVLSFCMDSIYILNHRDCILGSIAIAFDVLNLEAIEQNKTLEDHLAHLMVHSMLHLLGYDHKSDQERQEMEMLEIDILGKIGISNPYIIEDC